MKHKWLLFFLITIFCLLGTLSLGYIAYTSTPPSNSSKFIEVTKTIFLCLGGLGVILPLYINSTNSIENRTAEKIENTYSLIEKWDDPLLFSARKLTREIKESRSSLSDDALVEKIKGDDELKQSVILISNYFEQVRFSVINNRIDTKQFTGALGPVIIDIINRFDPYYRTRDKQVTDDLKQLKKLLS